MSSFVSTKHEIECEKLSRNNPFALKKKKKIEMCYYISFVDNNCKIHNTHMRLICIHKGNNLFLPSTFPEEKASNVCSTCTGLHIWDLFPGRKKLQHRIFLLPLKTYVPEEKISKGFIEVTESTLWRLDLYPFPLLLVLLNCQIIV